MSSTLRLPLPRRVVPIPRISVTPRPAPTMANPITVAKAPLGAFGPVPDDAKTKPHHEKTKSGKFIKFQNIHASFGEQSFSPARMGLKMLW